MYLYITIDAEAVHGDDPLNQMMWGRIPGYKEEYGIGMICDICEEFNYRATFFLDVYEHSFYGKDKISEVAKYLDGRGHDVQLHTHPAWYRDVRDSSEIQSMKAASSCFPAERYWMYMNTLEEQIEIVRHGKELLEEWLKKPVVAHRAGAYALNQETLTALKENNIFIDSSMHYKHPNCQITWTKNATIEKDDILEVPVTGVDSNRFLNLLVFSKKMGGGFRNTDINWLPLEGLIFYADEAIRNNLSSMNLFLHSYSLVSFNNNFTNWAPNIAAIDRFRRFLYYCRDNKNIENITFRELDKKRIEGSFQTDKDDFVPRWDEKISIGEAMARKIKYLYFNK